MFKKIIKNIKDKYYSHLLNNFFLNSEVAEKKIENILSKMQKNTHFNEFVKKYKYPDNFETGYDLLHFIIINDLINKDNFEKIKKVFDSNDFKRKNIIANSSNYLSAYYTLALLSPEYFVRTINHYEENINSFLLDNNNFINTFNKELKITEIIEKNYNNRDFINMIAINIKPTDPIGWDTILPKVLYHANEYVFKRFLNKDFYNNHNLLKILNDSLLLNDSNYYLRGNDKKTEIKNGFLSIKKKYLTLLPNEQFDFNNNLMTNENIFLFNELELIPFISQNNYISIIKSIFEKEYINNNYFTDNMKKNEEVMEILKEKIAKEKEPDLKDYFVKISFDLYFAQNENNRMKIHWMDQYFNYNLNDVDEEGNTFLHKGMAKYSEFFDNEYLDLLIKDNIDLYKKNNAGLRFYNYASEDKKNEIIFVLKEKEIKREKEKIKPLISLSIVDKIKKKKRL